MDEKPPEKPTLEIPKASETEILIGEIRSLRVGQETGFRQVNLSLDLMAGDIRRAHQRIDANDEELRALAGRQSSNSMRVREASQQNLEQDAELAKEKLAREALAAKVDTVLAIGTRFEKLIDRPLVKVLGFILLSAATTYAAAHGIQVKP